MARSFKLSESAARKVAKATKKALTTDLTGKRKAQPGGKLSNLLVLVSGNASGGGKYTGSILLPPAADISASGNLSLSELGDEGADVLILNGTELGQSTHLLTAGTPKAKVFQATPIRRNSNGTLVVWIDADDWGACT